MAKRVKKRSRAAKKDERQTNWLLIGGIVGVGVFALFGLLFLSLQGSGPPTPVPTPTRSFLLEDYCQNNPENCIVDGAEDAPVTIVEVSDYGCGHCKNFNLGTAPTLKSQYIDTGIVRWITVPYALGNLQNGYPTAPSANAALCAAEQGAFDEYHAALFELQGTGSYNTPDGFVEVADNLALDSDALATCVEDGRYDDIVSQNIQTINASGINSTPSFFINGELFRGNLPLDNFRTVIETEANS